MNKELKEKILKVITQILPMMGDDLKLKFVNTQKKDLSNFHFGFGTWIRNNILTTDRELYSLFIKNGIDYPDDMSAVILNELHRFLCKQKNFH